MIHLDYDEGVLYLSYVKALQISVEHLVKERNWIWIDSLKVFFEFIQFYFERNPWLRLSHKHVVKPDWTPRRDMCSSHFKSPIKEDAFKSRQLHFEKLAFTFSLRNDLFSSFPDCCTSKIPSGLWSIRNPKSKIKIVFRAQQW